MLGKNGTRELCYVVKVDRIEPIAGRDRVESAIVNGWSCMTPKGAFKEGDLGVYFEIDSKLPEKEPFLFLAAKHYKIKTQRYKTPDGPYYSQGLLMPFSDFGKTWELGTFLTEELGVTYAEVADNKRKASTVDKYKSMAQRHGKLFSKKPFRWLMKRSWGRKLLFLFFGRKKDKKKDWPAWVVKTDEERIQNLVSRIPEFINEPWYMTEKVDGTSSTFTLKRKKGYFVCSRNVVFKDEKQPCFYDSNVYLEMSHKYEIEKILKEIMSKDKTLEFVTLQGEVYGEGIQKRDYSIKYHDLAIFNCIFGYKDGTVKRLNPIEMIEFLEQYKLPCVPLLGKIDLPDSCEKILDLAGGASQLDGKPREGIVFRNESGTKSFKAVDNEFLMKFH